MEREKTDPESLHEIVHIDWGVEIYDEEKGEGEIVERCETKAIAERAAALMQRGNPQLVIRVINTER
jgi:hypothetical protein